MDAQLVTLLWQSKDTDIIPFFHVYENYFDIWPLAQQLYINDIVHLYKIISNLFYFQKRDSGVAIWVIFSLLWQILMQHSLL